MFFVCRCDKLWYQYMTVLGNNAAISHYLLYTLVIFNRLLFDRWEDKLTDSLSVMYLHTFSHTHTHTHTHTHECIYIQIHAVMHKITITTHQQHTRQ